MRSAPISRRSPFHLVHAIPGVLINLSDERPKIRAAPWLMGVYFLVPDVSLFRCLRQTASPGIFPSWPSAVEPPNALTTARFCLTLARGTRQASTKAAGRTLHNAGKFGNGTSG